MPTTFPDGFVRQDYLGVDKTYYQPTDRGYEAEIARRMAELRERAAAADDAPERPLAPAMRRPQSTQGVQCRGSLRGRAGG